MNERDIPSVPITTLAGVASLTDLLPVLPLPTPLPSTLSNKSQLFHPRVAEEAAILLATRDDSLVGLLVQSLMQTSADHIELKEESPAADPSQSRRHSRPELLKAIIEANPNAFEGGRRNGHERERAPAKCNGLSPGEAAGVAGAPPRAPRPSGRPGEAAAPAGSPRATMGSPPSQARPTPAALPEARWPEPPQPPRATVIAEPPPHNGLFFEAPPDDRDPLSPDSPQRPPPVDRLFRPPDPEADASSGYGAAESAGAAEIPLAPLEPQSPLAVKGYPAPDVVRLPFIKLDRLNLEDGLLKKLKSPSSESGEMGAQRTAASDSDDDAPLKPKAERPPADRFQTEIDLARERSWQAVKRKHEEANKAEEMHSATIVKPKLRKVERRLVPVIEMLSVDELMETNTYQRFNKLMDAVFDVIDDDTMVLNDDVDGMGVPEEWLVPRHQVQELCAEAAKLKALGAMQAIPAERLVRLLAILEKNVRAGERISPLGDPDDSEDVRLMWMETTMERVMGACDSGLTALYIMTAPNMPKRVYLEDVIDRIVMFTKFQLHNTIYCTYDPVYTIQSTSKKKGEKAGKRRGGGGAGGWAKGWKAGGGGAKELYARAHEAVALLAELLGGHALTDTTVLHASTLAVSPFFVENVSELQLSALKLVTTIFTKYEQHRRLLLEDILASIARIPSTKHNLRSYRLSSDEHIQMLTALVLQLVQCVVRLPDNITNTQPGQRWNDNADEEKLPPKMSQVDKDVFLTSKYDAAVSIGGTFLTSFLNKCRSRSEEVDFRPLFENFVHDLLTTVNKPEWPATELLLSLLGTMLVKYVSDKSMEMSVRVASLDYLGLVAARLRKDTVQSRGKLSTMDLIIKDIKTEEEKDGVIGLSIPECSDVDEERTLFLQRVLLDYLAVNGQKDEAWSCARHFYITQWYRDAISQLKTPSVPRRSTPHKGKKKYKVESSEEESASEEEDSERISKRAAKVDTISNAEKLKSVDKRKHFFLDKIKPFRYQGGSQVQVMQSYIDYSGAELIAQYLASKRSFSQSFDKYLQKILLILCENTIAIRTKAMKCLALIVEADPAVLARGDMQAGVHRSFLDQSTSVREAAVDLVGKFVLSRPDLIDKYYSMLSTRILDTGVSVRKRVIKILKDICIECPEFPKIPEICVKMIRRVNDEEGIRKLVMEVFQNMWFSPCPVRRHTPAILDPSADPLTRKVHNITDVVLSSRDIGLEWFQQLLQSLFKPREDKEDSTKIHYAPPKSLLLACQQIVDCLMENLLRIEESSVDGQGTSQRLVACLSTIHLFAKIRPQLLVSHAHTLQPYLSLKCQTASDQKIISCVASTLELVVPLMEHPSETFLAQLEEDSVKLILQHGQVVIGSCLSCLGSIVNSVTKNFKLIRDVFQKYHGVLMKWKQGWQISPERTRNLHMRPQFRRALFIVGLLLRHFDFTDPNVITGLPIDIKDQVFSTLMFFLQLDDEDFQSHTLKAIGSVCVRHYEFMLQTELKEFYHYLLTSDLASLDMKADVLRNVEMYLLEEEQRMIRQDKEWAKRSKLENLKEMGDVSSGMASTVIQLYLKEILGAFLHPSTIVRTSTMKVVQLVLAQGLVHPVQIVPYLICMSTDTEVTVSHTADKQLQEIDKKYPGFIHMKSQLGVKLSYELQKVLQIKSKHGIIRGFRLKDQDEYPTALNGFLYSLLRSTRPQRRALVLSILKQFDDRVLQKSSLEQMLYLADNMAYFPYQVQDEPLFIIHHIDIFISTSGSNLLQLFRESLLPKTTAAPGVDPNTGLPIPMCIPTIDGELDDDEDDDADSLLLRFPEDTTQLRACMAAAQGCLLLLVLKLHLKQTYGITDAKISQYSPSESVKVYEKAINRRSVPKFSPKVTIGKIKHPDSDDELDEQGRTKLINDYIEFKQLMLKFDPEEEEEDETPASADTTVVAPPEGDATQTPTQTPMQTAST